MKYPEDEFIFVSSWRESVSLSDIRSEIVVVIPSISIDVARKTARVLVRKAGLKCSVLIFHDDLLKGYINVINHCFKATSNPFFVFTAEDVFPGRDWLKHAFMDMINGGLGLVSFNDGKWSGKVASFGLVRRTWAEGLYAGNLFFSAYKRHAADNELTAIARYQGQYKYSSQATLLEIDFEKPWENKTDSNDWNLFVNRLKRGFFGVLTREGVEAELRLYSRPDPSAGDFEKVQGRFNKHEVLALIHQVVKPKFYFEIGVQHGYSLALAKCPALGVDPAPVLKVGLPATSEVVSLSSDDFFALGLEESFPSPELAFVDGMHLAEYAARDLLNIVRWANKPLVIVIDDVFPNHDAQGRRIRSTRHWAGDVWKVVKLLEDANQEIRMLFIDAFPTGLCFVYIDPANVNSLKEKFKLQLKSLSFDLPVDPRYLNRKFREIELQQRFDINTLRSHLLQFLADASIYTTSSEPGTST